MRTSARSPFVFRALLPLCAALLAACGSTGADETSAQPRPIAVALIGYGPSPFLLVSESHTSRVELYSNERKDASTKVLNDEVMQALVEHLDELGFDGYARPGSAPSHAGGAVSKALEVEESGQRHWWAVTAGADADELKSFNLAVRDFLGLFNIAQGWQSVDNSLGGEYFDQKKAKGGH